VEEGRLVTEEDTVCIIEVMKLFNTVKAGVRGRIVKVCVDNSQMVEYQQTLFLVEEGEDGKET
jgi:biotin carboxyl carrier protein